MSDLVDRVLALWDDDSLSEGEALEQFRTCYADPVRVNGTPTPVADLASRAMMLRGALADRHTVVHDVVEGDGFLAVAFDIHARHVGPAFGISAVVEPTGREVVVHGMDIFHLSTDGRVAALWAVNDQSDLLTDNPAS
jgi:hypothetical protein